MRDGLICLSLRRRLVTKVSFFLIFGCFSVVQVAPGSSSALYMFFVISCSIFLFYFPIEKETTGPPPMMYTSALLAGDLSWPPLDALAVYFGREKEQTHCGRDDPLRKMGEQLRRRTRGDSREIDTQQQPASTLCVFVHRLFLSLPKKKKISCRHGCLVIQQPLLLYRLCVAGAMFFFSFGGGLLLLHARITVAFILLPGRWVVCWPSCSKELTRNTQMELHNSSLVPSQAWIPNEFFFSFSFLKFSEILVGLQILTDFSYTQK